jgi:plastocyanin
MRRRGCSFRRIGGSVAAMLLGFVIVAMFAGCGGGTSGATTGPSATAAPSATTAPGATAAPSATTASPASSTGGGQSATVEVVMKDIKFVPDSLTIKVGQTVTWVNQDNATHDVVATQGEFKSDLFGKGQSFSFTFSKAGTYPYYCSVHPTMKGAIVVQ